MRPRFANAVQLRDHALKLIGAKSYSEAGFPTWTSGAFKAWLVPPFTPMVSKGTSYAPRMRVASATLRKTMAEIEAAYRQLARRTYALDVFYEKRKVLSVAWLEGGTDEIEIISFRRGIWEDEFLAEGS